jgi:hypothetical protein
MAYLRPSGRAAGLRMEPCARSPALLLRGGSMEWGYRVLHGAAPWCRWRGSGERRALLFVEARAAFARLRVGLVDVAWSMQTRWY